MRSLFAGAAVPEILRTYSWRYVEIAILAAVPSATSSRRLSVEFTAALGPQRRHCVRTRITGRRPAAFGQMPSGDQCNRVAVNRLGTGGEVVTNFSVVRIEHSGRNLMNFIHAASPPVPLSAPWASANSSNVPQMFFALAFLSLLMALAFTLPFENVSPTPQSRKTPTKLSDEPTAHALAHDAHSTFTGRRDWTSNWIAEYFVQSLAYQRPLEPIPFRCS